jgi:3-deoxy-D-manno-octulosonic-acid transferase
VGETVAAAVLVERLTALDLSVLLTTGTVTGAQVAERRLPAGALHQYAPIDTPGAVGRFLRHWRPDLALFAESELWPTTLSALAARALPLVVFNARMSERSFRGWRMFAPVARALMSRVDLCLAQTDADAARLATLGARSVSVCGNLKFDVPAPPADEEAVALLSRQIGDRFVFLAASTHPGEESAVLAAHADLVGRGARLVTIIAPRHPERGAALANETATVGLAVSRRSCGEAVTDGTSIYLADTIGEMGIWYRLADAAFLGGSIVLHGGQNPIEAAKLGAPILHGPHVRNFAEVYDAFAASCAALPVHDAASLANAVQGLMQDGGERERMAGAARSCAEGLTGALERTLVALGPYISGLVDDLTVAASA